MLVLLLVVSLSSAKLILIYIKNYNDSTLKRKIFYAVESYQQWHYATTFSTAGCLVIANKASEYEALTCNLIRFNGFCVYTFVRLKCFYLIYTP